MTFEYFVAEVTNRIKDFLPQKFEKATVETQKIHKIGESYLGMTVVDHSVDTAVPTINLNMYYNSVFNGNMDAVLKEMAGVIISNDEKFADCLSWIKDYANVKDHLFIRVSNKFRNENILESAPHKLLAGDLVITYHVQMDVTGEGVASMLITNQALKMYGISEEELHHDALENSMAIFPAYISTMEEVMERLFHTPKANNGKGKEVLVLTNQQKVNGATTLFYPGVMKEISKEMKGSYYVVPSSVHELIIMPEKIDVEKLVETVKAVNKTLIPKDFLSNHIFHYDAEKQRFEMVIDRGLA